MRVRSHYGDILDQMSSTFHPPCSTVTYSGTDNTIIQHPDHIWNIVHEGGADLSERPSDSSQQLVQLLGQDADAASQLADTFLQSSINSITQINAAVKGNHIVEQCVKQSDLYKQNANLDRNSASLPDTNLSHHIPSVHQPGLQVRAPVYV